MAFSFYTSRNNLIALLDSCTNQTVYLLVNGDASDAQFSSTISNLSLPCPPYCDTKAIVYDSKALYDAVILCGNIVQVSFIFDENNNILILGGSNITFSPIGTITLW